MLNLLSNAIKYTKPGGTIYVNIYDSDEHVSISIKDTGVGIPGQMISVIFKRFRQVESLLTRRSEGSGIGLSLVKALVEAHGGNIMAKSKYGHGSEFVVKLPNRIESFVEDSIIKEEAFKQDKVERINIEFSDIYGT